MSSRYWQLFLAFEFWSIQCCILIPTDSQMFILKFEYSTFKIKKAPHRRDGIRMWNDTVPSLSNLSILWRAGWLFGVESSPTPFQAIPTNPTSPPHHETMSAATIPTSPYEDPFPCISGHAGTPRDSLPYVLHIRLIKIGRIVLISCRRS